MAQMRYIPKKTKVKMEFFKGITLSDIAVAAIGLGGSAGLIFSNLPYGVYFGIAFLTFSVTMFFPIEEGVRLYGAIGLLFRFFAFKRKFIKGDVILKRKDTIHEIIPFQGILNERYIDYKDYFAEVIEIRPVEFALLNEYKQDALIKTLSNAMSRLTNEQTMSIVKVNKAMVFDDYIQNEDKKYDSIMELQYEGEMSEEEVEARAPVFEARVSVLEGMNRGDDKVYKDYFYIVVYDKDREALDNTVDGMISSMATSVMPLMGKRLKEKDLYVFIRSTYGKDFDQRDLETLPYNKFKDWAVPDSVVFKAGKTMINKAPYRSFVISDYPLQVGNAWGYSFFSLQNTNVVMNLTPIPKAVAEKRIDKAIVEMEGKAAYTAKSSKVLETQTHLKTLKELLQQIKNGGDTLYDVNIHLMCEDSSKKEVRAILKQYGFKFSEMFGRQVDAFVSRSISKLDTVKQFVRNIPSSTLACVFPFISGALQDEKGFYLGYNEYPVLVNFFTRNSERVNSNMMIIGKSGSGKSFATKTLLTNLAADNAKIFILDPEDEYSKMAYNLKGNVMDVGSSISGRLNPFHILTTLESDEGGASDDFSTHLQFLEQFFKVILPGISSDAFERLNSLIIETYARKGISSKTVMKDLKPEDFPIFDDLYAVIKEKLYGEENKVEEEESEKPPYAALLEKMSHKTDEYERQNLQIIETYISKFATGGRNSNLWNGPMSLATKENFITFSFRSLLANRNEGISNAQMLLVFKYLDNEIIKNKDFNDKYATNRKIIVVVDEAHVFINPKFPVALDFMMQMAKRIRKYGGMQIVITQNIKDFIGSPEIERQSSAIINASQYSLIMSLAPNDITDLVSLYRNAGGINQEEQDSIVTAGVGQGFLITSATSRTTLKVEPNETVKQLFS